jgi:peptide/nickel transport system substrate-binding protein
VRHPITRWIGAAALIAVVWSGCGSDSDSGSEGAPVSKGDVSFSMAIGEEPGNLDPLRFDDGQADSFNSSVYERLVARSADGESIEPALATEWEQSDRGYTFKLREGVTFHDGSTFDADDVIASVDRLLAEGGEEIGTTLLDDTKVEAIDPMTVEVYRPVPDATIPARMSLVSIVPAELAPADNEQLNSEMVGTGPYQFGEWRRGSEITLTRFADYWGDEPQIKDVTIKFLPEESVRLSALRAGEIQLARNMAPDLQGQAPQVVSGPQSEVSFLKMNSLNGGPFEDPEVRRAASLAIDRDSLLENIYQGFAKPANGQLVGPYVFGYNPDLGADTFDPDEAKRIVQETGAGSKEIQMTLSSGRWLRDREAGQAIAQMLRDVGFNVKATTVEFSVWVEQTFAPPEKAPDLLIPGTSNQLFDSSLSIPLFLSCGGAASTYCNEDVDEQATAAVAELDEDTRAGMYHEIWQKLNDDSAYAAIAEVYQIHFLADGVDWQPRADGFIKVQDISLTG